MRRQAQIARKIMTKREALQTTALIIWALAALMMVALIDETRRLKRHVEEMNAHSEELVRNTDKLKQSFDRLDDSVHRFIEQYRAAQEAQQAQPATSASSGVR